MQSLKKIKRVQPLIKLKRTKVDEEATILQEIRARKVKVVQSMKENQRRYMDGIEKLNKVRTSRVRENLETLESALDHVKAEWYRLYQQVQDIEAKERAQIHQLLVAERELKSVEKLEERYKDEARRELGKVEQRQLDEIALRLFTSR